MQLPPSKFFDFTATEATLVTPLPNARSVMGVNLVDETSETAIAAILASGKRSVFFLNAHCVNVMAGDPDYQDALARADMVLPDGIGIELAARMTGGPLTENLNGTDLMPKLLSAAAVQGKSVFLFGASPGAAIRAAAHIQKEIPNLRIAGTRDGYDGADDAPAAIRAINRSRADIVLVAMGVPRQELWIDTYGAFISAKLTIAVGGLFDFWAGNVSRAPKIIRHAKSEWVWRLAQEPRRLAHRYLIGNGVFMARAAAYAWRQRDRHSQRKRLFDGIASAGALLALAPLFLTISAAIRLESKGSPIFSQRRVGKNGRIFTLYKFRSMEMAAEQKRDKLLAASHRKGLCFKSQNDPRITRVGRFLRRTSLDELPQILNILLGDMSFVGPRPALPEEVAQYSDHHRERLEVKPGLTGLWQVAGRADIDFERMVEMDIAYCRSRSLVLDFALIGQTFRAVTTGRGAY